MGEEDKKCLFCFPIECGVATMAVLCALGSVHIGYTAQTTENGWATYGVNFACVLTTVLSFVYAYLAPSEQSRKIVFLFWIIFICGITRIWYTYVILRGDVWKQICNDGAVEALSPLGMADNIATEDCIYGGKKTVWIEHLGGWVFDFYFAYVMRQWSKNIDVDDSSFQA